MPKKTKKTKAPKKTKVSELLAKDVFNVFQTFHKAAPGAAYDWVQVIDGRPVMVWTRQEFKKELVLLAMDL